MYGKTFFRKSNLGKMFQMVRTIHSRNRIESYVILHSGLKDGLERYELEMEQITGRKPLYISNVSSVIGLNAGEGAVSVAMLLSEDNKRGNV
ncbi:hypothetical protein D3C78_909380 [compost metagenome]